MSRQWTETHDGQEFTVTRLPSDKRLQPSQVRKRALWNRLSPHQKRRLIEGQIQQAKKRRRQKRKAA